TMASARISACLADISSWMTAHQLKLNPSKTELLIIPGDPSPAQDLAISLSNMISPSATAHNLGVTMDNQLSFSSHVTNVTRSCRFLLYNIRRIRPFLSTQATQVLVQSLVISRLDYCNSLLAGLLLNAIRPLQMIQNAAAQLVFNLPKFSHTTPLLRSLHWFSVAARIRFKTLMLAYKAKNGPAPSYLKALVTPRTAPRSLRSTSIARLVPPSLREKVGGAVALFKCFKKRKRGKQAGALVKLRQRGFRTVLPSIHLANLRSLPNKMDELLLLSRTNKDFSNSAALCFTESWLNDAIPDSALNLPGFQLFRADRVAESAGKSRGGGTCFYINERWCTDVTVLKKMCCPDLEAFFINCKPFYSPREFSSFILVSVYIPPQAHVSSALQHLADQITHTEQQHPDSVIIILGDFNKANLSHELPKFKQHISCPTRDKNILDHCYTTIKDAYRSVPRAALGLSDHCLVHLLPTYRPKLKSAKPVVRTVKRWTSETEQDLQACFECTDWSIFEAGATDLDELTETVTSYISFCEDMCIPTRTYLSFNNDKPWFTSKLRHLRQAKEDAFRNGDRVLYNQARNTLNKEIRVAKRSYAKKLENQFSANDPASVWKGLKYITNYKTPSPSTEANQQLAEDLNEFYCRFETAGLTPHAPSEHLSIQPLTPPATPLSPPPALRISEDDVRQIFLKQKKRKAPGPDGVTPVCLRTCADQLAFIFSQIFNRSLELCEVPACFKRSTIIPIPKKPKMTGLNDYRPVALTSVVMKSFKRLVLAYLKNITGPLLEPLQFAYRANSSAFNTIIPTLLQTKLTQLSVPSSICQWITSFLTDRHQLVKLGKFKSNSRTTSTGAPQGCVLSPLLFSLYTNDCTSTDPSIKLLKFADDTTVIGLIQDGDESAYRQEIELPGVVVTIWSSTHSKQWK
ncbi:hypothetical protein QTP70_002915, partial [Hemibagrus guttatus]